MKPPKDDSGQVWFKLAQWFQEKIFFKSLDDDGCQMMAIAHTGVGTSWQAEHICSLNLTSISYSFWNKGWKVLKFWKFDEKWQQLQDR